MEDLNAALPELERTAYDACGGAYPVHAALEMTEFPRKEYDGFALPAGEYMALRIIIGEGAGRNWWCVLYPGLCRTACGGYAVSYSEPYTPPETDAADGAVSESGSGIAAGNNAGGAAQ